MKNVMLALLGVSALLTSCNTEQRTIKETKEVRTTEETKTDKDSDDDKK